MHSGPVLRKKDINRCTSLPCSSNSWASRSTEETRDHLDDPPAKTTCFSPLTNPRMHRPQRGKLQPPRVSWSSSGLRFFTSLLIFFSFFLCFLPSCSRVRPQGFDGPRGDFPGRRGSTEGASHTRLGHEPRPSDLLKISIVLVRRPSRPPSWTRRKAQTGPPSTALPPPLHPDRSYSFFRSRVPPSFSLPRAQGPRGAGERHARNEISASRVSTDCFH